MSGYATPARRAALKEVMVESYAIILACCWSAVPASLAPYNPLALQQGQRSKNNTRVLQQPWNLFFLRWPEESYVLPVLRKSSSSFGPSLF